MQNRLLKLMLMVGLIPFYAVSAQPDGEFFSDETNEGLHKKLKNNNGNTVVKNQDLEEGQHVKEYIPVQLIQAQHFQPQVQQVPHYQFQQQQGQSPEGLHTGMNGTFYNNPPKPPQLRPLNPQNLTELTNTVFNKH